MDIRKIDAEDTWEIRHKVMWPNKNIDYVKLENDHEGIHYGVIERDFIIAVISMFINNGRVQFRKFATLKDKQGQGYGTKLLKYIMEEAAKLGGTYIWCNARKEKISFYRRFGLVETESTFERNGVKYVIMGKYLV